MVKPFEETILVDYRYIHFNAVIRRCWITTSPKTGLYDNRGFTIEEKGQIITGHWAIISFFVALCIVLWLLRTDIRDRHLDPMRSSVPATIGWIFIGFFLAIISQSIAGMIEMYVFGVPRGSENTDRLMDIARTIPWFLIVVSIIDLS